MVDSFGKNLNIIKDGEGYYKTSIKTSEPGIVYFALQYIDKLEILSPKSIRETIKKSLTNGLKVYK